jgi:hypothetical protein
MIRSLRFMVLVQLADFIGNINWSAKPLPRRSVIWFPAGT